MYMCMVINAESGKCDLHKWNAEPTLEWLKEIVGGWIDIVRCDSSINGFAYPMMVVNDEGLRLELPYNEFATRLYRRGDPIVGNVVVCLNFDFT